MMALMSPKRPIHPMKEILSSVWIEDTRKLRIAATRTKTTVQVPWVLSALSAVENPMRPAPAMAVRLICD
jgi:hypothetical protein